MEISIYENKLDENKIEENEIEKKSPEKNKQKYKLTIKILEGLEEYWGHHNPNSIISLYVETAVNLIRNNLKLYEDMIDNDVLCHMENKIYEYLEKTNDLINQDELTGLANLRGFKKGAERCMSRLKREKYLKNGKEIALVYLDLNYFKRFNDIYGHQEGDKILKYTSKALKTYSRNIDLPARLGGDEFIVLFDEFAKLENIENYNNFLKNLNKNINNYIKKYNENSEIITVSMGMSIFGKDANNLEELLKNADNAMYHAKYHTDNEGLNYYIYDPNETYIKRKDRRERR